MNVVGWEVVLALITISTLMGVGIKVANAMSKPIHEVGQELKLSVTELNATLKSIQEENKESKRINEKEHDEIYDTLKNHGDRIVKIETSHENNHPKEVK